MQNDRFDAIPIPKELSSAVKAGIQEGIRQQKKLHRNRAALRYSAIAAAALVAICAGVLLVSDPSMAAKLPVVGRIFSMVQEKIGYKGNFSDNAEVYVEEEESGSRREDMGQESEGGADGISGEKESNPYVQTSNGLTVTVSESSCSSQALYLALCIENEEAFPEDFMSTLDLGSYQILYLQSDSYYNVPGLGKEDRGAARGYPGPYYIEGEYVDDHTFTGIIRVSLDEDVTRSIHVLNRNEAENDADLIWDGEKPELPEQFTYYLEISDFYGEVEEYEEVLLRDVDGEEIMYRQPLQKHYEGTWNFAIDVRMNRDGEETVQVNETNENGVGIASVEKTDFEIKAELILPEGVDKFDYIIAICDADGKKLESQGQNAEVFSVYGRNTDTVYVYVCDFMQYMDELKGDDRKIAEGALFGTEVHFK